MGNKLRVSADDLGITRTATDSLFAAADTGALTHVSILANGEATDYAVEEYAKRAPSLTLSVHLNLTEGPSRSCKETSLITDRRGWFRHSPVSLWFAYLRASRTTKEEYTRLVAQELTSQYTYIRELLAVHGLSVTAVDGHQHVHMIPFVFDILPKLGIQSVRIVREEWYATPLGLIRAFGPRALALLVLRALSTRNIRIARNAGIQSNDWFIGFLYAGVMTEVATRNGLAATHAVLQKGKSVELLFHPGSALSEELGDWRGAHTDTDWHCSPWRAREREFIESSRFISLLQNPALEDHFSTILRFGMSGAVVALVDLSLLYLFTSVFGIWYVGSASLAFCLAFLVCYTLQKSWTFKDGAPLLLRMPLYFGLQLTNLVLNAFLLYIAVAMFGFPYLPAEFIVLLLIACESFLIMKFVIFRRHPHA
jgi:predicted glycoside hydrolase/deacetylase ChbG (UPF0249 family)/putative flippase GtrA